jgi:hypothetical protein
MLMVWAAHPVMGQAGKRNPKPVDKWPERVVIADHADNLSGQVSNSIKQEELAKAVRFPRGTDNNWTPLSAGHPHGCTRWEYIP